MEVRGGDVRGREKSRGDSTQEGERVGGKVGDVLNKTKIQACIC